MVVSSNTTAAGQLFQVGERLRALTLRRDELVVAARAEGLSLRAIAELAGISHAGVRRILDRVRP